MNIKDIEFIAAAFEMTIAEAINMPWADQMAAYEAADAQYPCGTVHPGACLSTIMESAAAAGDVISGEDFLAMLGA